MHPICLYGTLLFIYYCHETTPLPLWQSSMLCCQDSRFGLFVNKSLNVVSFDVLFTLHFCCQFQGQVTHTFNNNIFDVILIFEAILSWAIMEGLWGHPVLFSGILLLKSNLPVLQNLCHISRYGNSFLFCHFKATCICSLLGIKVSVCEIWLSVLYFDPAVSIHWSSWCCITGILCQCECQKLVVCHKCTCID